MKIKEISASISGVIPIASYENLRPGYTISAELEEGEDANTAFKSIKDIIRLHFENECNRAKTDLIEKQYSNIRFYEVGDKKYPSVTSILGWNIDWKISEDELQQYASRGTIIHKLIEIYLTQNRWANPIDLPELENDVTILLSGSKGLTWKDCSYEKALESIRKDIKMIGTEETLHNDEHLYAGRVDTICEYEGKVSVLDFKSGTTIDMRQLAAYAACLENIEQLVIVPVGPTDNKCGIKKPIICTNIQKEFKGFLYARAKFRERFGI